MPIDSATVAIASAAADQAPARVQSILSRTAAPLTGDDMDGLRATVYAAPLPSTTCWWEGSRRGREARPARRERCWCGFRTTARSSTSTDNWRPETSCTTRVIHVRMIVRFPERARHPSGRRAGSMLVEVFPTVLGLLGFPNDLPTLDGRNALRDARCASPRPIFSEQLAVRGRGIRGRAWSLSRDGLKLTETRDVTASKEGFGALRPEGRPPRTEEFVPGGGGARWRRGSSRRSSRAIQA